MAQELGALGVGTPVRAPITTVPMLRVDVAEDASAVVLTLQGEADLATAPHLAHALAQASEDGSASVVLDAARLEFIDAYCLGVIANARALLRGQGRDLVVRSPVPLFRRILSVLEMEDLIEQATQELSTSAGRTPEVQERVNSLSHKIPDSLHPTEAQNIRR